MKRQKSQFSDFSIKKHMEMIVSNGQNKPNIGPFFLTVESIAVFENSEETS